MSAALRIAAGLFCAALLLGGLGGDLIRNEGLRARLAAEAMAGGDWLVPTLSGEPHLSKPPGMSVLIVLCSLPFGEVTTVSARLPSVLAGAATLLMWAWMFRRVCGPPAGLLALVVMPCSWLWLDRVPSAEIDLVQLTWVSGAMLCLLRAVDCITPPPNPLSASGRGSSKPDAAARELLPFSALSASGRGAGGEGWWLAAMLCVAGGLFTKWTAPAFFYLAAVPWLWRQGRLSLLLRWPHLAGLALTGLLMLAWLAHVGTAAGWDVLGETLRREALLRFSPGHHPRPYPWDELATFPLAFLAGCLPWSLVALATLRPSFVRTLDDRRRALWLLCQCWLWVNLIFWTLAPGHRPRHILPAHPAVAALAVLALNAWLRGPARWPSPRLRPSALLLPLLAGWLAVKLVFVAHVLPARQESRRPRAGGEELARLVPRGETLYLFRLKDDGVLFYYGRATRRLDAPGSLPGAGAWCLLTDAEFRAWPGGFEKRADLRDGQGARLVLARGRGEGQ